MQLSAENAAAVANSLGLLAGTSAPTIRDLSAGGVSNAVFKIESESDCLVLKQPLARLRVRAEWRIDRVRVLREAEGLRLWNQLVKCEAAPAVHCVDKTNYILAMSCAPRGHRNWKSELMAGRTDRAAAATLGTQLARWQRAGAGEPDLARKLPADDTFVQGRLEPYLGEQLRNRLPGEEAALAALSADLLGNRVCLVHGDFSPKNVLVGAAGRVFLLDFEICHFGHPAFDPAFMLTHLLLKSQHRPTGAAAYLGLAQEFWDYYRRGLGGWLIEDQEEATRRCLGGLLLARVHGKSPAEYLTDAGARARVLDLGRRLLADSGGGVAGACRMAARSARGSN